MSLRRLLILVRGLPPEARVRSIDPDQPWPIATELLAVAVELIHMQWTGFMMVNSKKGTKKPKPLRVPRPGEQVAKRKKRPATIAETMASLTRTFGAPVPQPADSEGAVIGG